jgi:Uma2 family endonuclease
MSRSLGRGWCQVEQQLHPGEAAAMFSQPDMGPPRMLIQLVAAIDRGYIHERRDNLETMVIPHPGRRLRAEDVPDIPVPDDISGYELVNGEPVPVMPSWKRHSWLAGQVFKALDAHAEATRAGTVFPDVWCKLPQLHDPERLYAPDISFFTSARMQAEPDDGIFHSPPDLAVEIFSESNRRKLADFQQRIRAYLHAGVRLLWVIYPDARYAMIHRSDGSATMVLETEALDGEDVLPGFGLYLGKLFDEMPGSRSAT